MLWNIMKADALKGLGCSRRWPSRCWGVLWSRAGQRVGPKGACRCGMQAGGQGCTRRGAPLPQVDGRLSERGLGPAWGVQVVGGSVWEEHHVARLLHTSKAAREATPTAAPHLTPSAVHTPHPPPFPALTCYTQQSSMHHVESEKSPLSICAPLSALPPRIFNSSLFWLRKCLFMSLRSALLSPHRKRNSAVMTPPTQASASLGCLALTESTDAPQLSPPLPPPSPLLVGGRVGGFEPLPPPPRSPEGLAGRSTVCRPPFLTAGG